MVLPCSQLPIFVLTSYNVLHYAGLLNCYISFYTRHMNNSSLYKYPLIYPSPCLCSPAVSYLNQYMVCLLKQMDNIKCNPIICLPFHDPIQTIIYMYSINYITTFSKNVLQMSTECYSNRIYTVITNLLNLFTLIEIVTTFKFIRTSFFPSSFPFSCKLAPQFHVRHIVSLLHTLPLLALPSCSSTQQSYLFYSSNITAFHF